MSYVLEVSWGCPNDKYPLNGLFQFDQAKALRDAGLDVVYLALDLRSFRRWRKWGVNRTERDGIPVYEYNYPCGPMKPGLKYSIQDKAFKRVISHIEREFDRPAVIHIHTCQQAISVTDHCARNNIPYVITEHITPLDETKPIEERKSAALHGAKQVISVSNALGRDLKRVYGVDSVTIPNIVDLSAFEYVPHNTDEKGTIRIISAAGMNHGKGFDILIRAYASLIKTHPDCHLTIMGDGPERGSIQRMCGELGVGIASNPDATAIGTVSFTGTYIRSDFATQLRTADFFVLPSRSETFGLVYAEALAAGVPVVATKCGGPEDFIDESNGLLVPVDDADALAEAMSHMIDSLDSYGRGAISDSCKKRFSPATVASQIKEYLN
ncbi:MAG: glycosyltransferase [Lachnospiraceae bacterium]|nr:glycosyltransferase [Lachnospiraceae bacterium]